MATVEPPRKLSAEVIPERVKAAVARHAHIRHHARELAAKFHPDAAPAEAPK